MWKSLQVLLKQNSNRLVLIVGCVLLLLDFVSIDVHTYVPSLRHPNPIVLTIALTLIIAGYMGDNFTLGLPFTRVRSEKHGYCIGLGRAVIRVSFGRIEDFQPPEAGTLYAFPVTEYFERDCLRDSRTSLGAFVCKHFEGQVDLFDSLVRRQLASMPTTELEKEEGIRAKSYGLGQCVFLDRPLQSQFRIAMVSVTKKRAGRGIFAEPQSPLLVIAPVEKLMADYQLEHLFMPVLGSGHGGLNDEGALACLLVGLRDVLKNAKGPIRSVNIIVFRPNAKSKPKVSEKRAKLLLTLVHTMREEPTT